MNEVDGCTDPEACNYDINAINDDGSCTYPADFGWCNCQGDDYLDVCGVCGGDNFCDGDMIDNNNDNYNETCSTTEYGGVEFDCSGVCFGLSIIDECGVCGGSGIPDGKCDCNGNILDCNNICGGLAVIDDCNICGGNNQYLDCNGICFGDAIADCDGICEGPALVDDCGICDGNYYFEDGLLPNGSCDCNGQYLDCNNQCTCVINDLSDSSCQTILDDCGNCGGTNFFGSTGQIIDGLNEGQCSCDGSNDLEPEFIGCDGLCSSVPAEIDLCSVCNGEGQIYNCGCEEIIFGENIDDACECIWQEGTAAITTLHIDECGICGGLGIEEGYCDCNEGIIDACYNCTSIPCDIVSEIPNGLQNNYLSSNILVPLLLTGYQNLEAIDIELTYDNQLIEFQDITFSGTSDEILKEDFLTIITNTDIFNSTVSISIFQNAGETVDGLDINFDDISDNDVFLYFMFDLAQINYDIHNASSTIGFNQFKVNNFDFISNSIEGDLNINIVGCLDINADNPNLEAINAVTEFGSEVINGLCQYSIITEVDEFGMIPDSIVISSSENDFELDISLGTQLLIDGEPVEGEIEISISGEQPSEEIEEILPNGLEISGEITSMEPLGLSMDPPAELEIGYSINNGRSVRNSSYSIYSLSSLESPEWEEIDGTICECNESCICIAEINTFAFYAILEIIKGCTDINAFNYNIDAIEDDGSCIYAGCTDINAFNYNIEAIVDDGSCIYDEEELNVSFPIENNILAIYPNPFNSILHIRIASDNIDKIELAVYNIYGKKIDIILSDYINNGINVINWNANNHPSGIYIIRYSSNTFSIMKKVVYLK